MHTGVNAQFSSKNCPHKVHYAAYVTYSWLPNIKRTSRADLQSHRSDASKPSVMSAAADAPAATAMPHLIMPGRSRVDAAC